jgi:hypothetical protein
VPTVGGCTAPAEAFHAVALNNTQNSTFLSEYFKAKVVRDFNNSAKMKKNHYEQYIQEFPKTRTVFPPLSGNKRQIGTHQP